MRRKFVASLLAAVLLVALASDARGSSATGTAGVDSSLPETDSVTTLHGRGDFKDMVLKINQTKNLVNQAVSITWTGAPPTITQPTQFSGNYLQIFQCWGDDDGTNAANPGPPPTQCAQGARNGVPGGVSGSPFPPGSFTTDRVISREGYTNYDPSKGAVDTKTKDVYLPFKGVNGTNVPIAVDTSFNETIEGGVYWNNPFYNFVTTNEIAGAQTLENGTGAELFEVATGIENSGLGCGQHVEPVVGGSPKVPKCWLVIVPRGTPRAENDDTPYRGDSAERFGTMTSPVAAAAWKNRISIPLEFNDIDSACDLSADSARMAGTELTSAAVSSWQPKLCTVQGLRPYAYGIVSDTSALQQLQNPSAGAPGMFVVTRPLDEDSEDSDNPTVYSPLTLSGLTLGFNFQRVPTLQADEAAHKLDGVRVTDVKITPRLLAKLLTQSYVAEIRIRELPKGDLADDYAWAGKNPEQLGADPDFLQFNPEFKEFYISFTRNFGGMLLPGGTSDAAQQVWNYILADPEAKKWMDGEADEWGMKVNPSYATKAEKNRDGVPFTAPNSFPKSDPYCYQSPPVGSRQVVPPPLCGTDWLPYAQSFRDGARLTRAGDDTSRIEPANDPPSSALAWKRTPPQSAGRTMLTLTDTPAANLFGLQMARLSRAGDNGDNRKFIAPTSQTIAAAVPAMKPAAGSAVLTPDPSAEAPGAYPLALVTYAAIRPLDLTTEQRAEYATFLEYGAGDGQKPGLEYGELPVGYAPLPDTLVTQAKNAAKSVRELTAKAVEEESVDTPRGADDNSGGSDFLSFAPGGSGTTFFDPSDAATITSPLPSAPSGNSNGNKTQSAAKKTVTPAVALPVSRFAIPALILIALLSAVGALQITKAPRRTRAVLS